jgi:hypothetical protein
MVLPPNGSLCALTIQNLREMREVLSTRIGSSSWLLRGYLNKSV